MGQWGELAQRGQELKFKGVRLGLKQTSSGMQGLSQKESG